MVINMGGSGFAGRGAPELAVRLARCLAPFAARWRYSRWQNSSKMPAVGHPPGRQPFQRLFCHHNPTVEALVSPACPSLSLRRWTPQLQPSLRDDLAARVLALYHRAHGRFRWIPVRATSTTTTEKEADAGNHESRFTVGDKASAGLYQLRKEYGVGGSPLGIDARRGSFINLFRTVIAAKWRPSVPAEADTTTGRLTISYAVNTY